MTGTDLGWCTGCTCTHLNKQKWILRYNTILPVVLSALHQQLVIPKDVFAQLHGPGTRLNGLVMLFIHWDIACDVETVVDEFA